MNITEACKSAINIGKTIARDWTLEENKTWKHTRILPTNTTRCCLVLVDCDGEEKEVVRWNPTLEDLIADDWKVIG